MWCLGAYSEVCIWNTTYIRHKGPLSPRNTSLHSPRSIYFLSQQQPGILSGWQVSFWPDQDSFILWRLHWELKLHFWPWLQASPLDSTPCLEPWIKWIPRLGWFYIESRIKAEHSMRKETKGSPSASVSQPGRIPRSRHVTLSCPGDDYQKHINQRSPKPGPLPLRQYILLKSPQW